MFSKYNSTHRSKHDNHYIIFEQSTYLQTISCMLVNAIPSYLNILRWKNQRASFTENLLRTVLTLDKDPKITLLDMMVALEVVQHKLLSRRKKI